ncbi:hypothetical protein Zmor_017871 [Zophobas morio]|uniref:Gustatory receptor n=1 Tax=Zophobas morio TaxID=2755281 RepID=A0AA38MD62_9CUCU|nr:hypothetical protein Zmor_017871 [Zophobas morio]
MSEKNVIVNQQLLHTILPLLKLSRFVGLCPVAYQPLHKNFSGIRWSWKIYALNFLFAVIFAFWGMWGFIKDMQLASFVSLGFTDTIDIVISTSDVTDIICTSFYFVISTPKRFKQLKIIIDNFDKIDFLIPPVRVKEISHTSTILGTCWTIFLPVLYILDLFMWGNFNWRGINSYCAYYVSYSVVIMHEMQYWQLITLTTSRILGVNTTLEEILNGKSADINKSLSAIIKSYHLIIDSINRINQCFSINASVIILSCYIHLVTSPYQLFVMITSNETSILNYVYLLWVSLQIFRLMLILEVCHNCTRESQKTRSYVVLLLVCKLDNNMKEDANTFLFVVNKKKIKFEAYGLQKIDRSLLISIADSISNYWMILLQFSRKRITV